MPPKHHKLSTNIALQNRRQDTACYVTFTICQSRPQWTDTGRSCVL